VASKPLLEDLPPLTLASLRVAIALVVLCIVMSHRHERPANGPAPALLGFVGVAVFCGAQNVGLLFADATMTTLVTGCIPVLTLGLAVPLLHERLDGPRLASVIISTLGVGVIVVAGSGQPPATALLIGLLPLASALASALSMVLGRRILVTGSPLAVVTGSTRYGLLFLLPFTVVELTTVEIGRVTSGDLVLLAYLGVGCSALAFLLRGYGLKHLDAGHGAVYGNLRPVIGVVLAVVLLREPLNSIHIAGGALVLIGVGLASRRPPLRFPRPRGHLLPKEGFRRAGIG
jgi:drug/metabolite transporter (DMT)-like permease